MKSSITNPGYKGAAMWVRIRHRFGPRIPEWFLSGHMILFGYVLLLPYQTFNQPAFSAFAALAPSETLLGWVISATGCLRIVGLTVNGARKDVTPQIRQFSAVVGCMMWAGISYAFASSGVMSTWFSIYPLFALEELVNIHRAAHDQGEARNGTNRTAQ